MGIKAGEIGAVLVKDMSRVGRDYLQVGFYTEILFRQHGIHFIAIANGIDSENQNLDSWTGRAGCARDFPVR